MAQWLQSDLAATNQQWIIAALHHPIYASSGNGGDMRENFVPILEAGGVDLVMYGHNHTYIRSFFLNGHYGALNTFNPAIHGNIFANGHLGDCLAACSDMNLSNSS